MYNDLRDHISGMLSAAGYVESVDTFTVDNLPETMADKSFSIQLKAIKPNGADTEDRIYPIYEVSITAIYAVGNNSFSRLDVAHTWNEELVAMVMNPGNRSTDTRVVNFAGSTFDDYENDGYFVIATNNFEVEMSLLYKTVLDGGDYTTSTFDETIEGGAYTDTNIISNTFEAGSYT
jgi:hypothetical protein